MSEPVVRVEMTARFEMVGDDDAGVCVDGVCVLPGVGTDASEPVSD